MRVISLYIRMYIAECKLQNVKCRVYWVKCTSYSLHRAVWGVCRHWVLNKHWTQPVVYSGEQLIGRSWNVKLVLQGQTDFYMHLCFIYLLHFPCLQIETVKARKLELWHIVPIWGKKCSGLYNINIYIYMWHHNKTIIL